MGKRSSVKALGKRDPMLDVIGGALSPVCMCAHAYWRWLKLECQRHFVPALQPPKGLSGSCGIGAQQGFPLAIGAEGPTFLGCQRGIAHPRSLGMPLLQPRMDFLLLVAIGSSHTAGEDSTLPTLEAPEDAPMTNLAIKCTQINVKHALYLKLGCARYSIPFCSLQMIVTLPLATTQKLVCTVFDVLQKKGEDGAEGF